jgi:hypothetical protein
MKNQKFGKGILFVIVFFVSTFFPTVVNAHEENNYSITAEEAYKHANAQMVDFIASGAPGFENWTGAYIDPKPLELYDINGQKLFYQFLVHKANKIIGTIDVCADKTLGPAVNDIEFDYYPLKVAEAMNKSIEIATKNYPNGEIKSTFMVEYSYPSIGAMTVVKDKVTGVEYRIFVDGYTLDEVPDRPATLTEPVGVWSMYEQRSNKGINENLNEWQKSDQLTKSVEQKAASEGINISAQVNEEEMKKLTNDTRTAEETSNLSGLAERTTVELNNSKTTMELNNSTNNIYDHNNKNSSNINISGENKSKKINHASDFELLGSLVCMYGGWKLRKK